MNQACPVCGEWMDEVENIEGGYHCDRCDAYYRLEDVELEMMLQLFGRKR